MAKRKSRAKSKQPKKRLDKLDTVFSCPFCNHARSVECCMIGTTPNKLMLVLRTGDMKHRIGEVTCVICKESFSTTATALSEPIDIYSEWIDECEKVNKQQPGDDGGAEEGKV